MHHLTRAPLFGALLIFSSPALSCSSCGCTLAADWLSQGLVSDPGTTFTLRADTVPQNQLRSGTSRVDRSAISFPATREIEQYTDNYYYTATLDHRFNSHWALSLALPYASHPHTTISEGDTSASTSQTEGLGDASLSMRYQMTGAHGVSGLTVGVKLPTGGFHQTFQTGPQAGQAVDRGLQMGSGTTNMRFGAYLNRSLVHQFAVMAQVNADLPLNTRDSYRPGNAYTATLGVQYSGWKSITPQLQLNARTATRDSGLNADPENSGGQHVTIAPGLTLPLTTRLSTFGIVQLPLYQHVNGYQLTPRYTASLGLSLRL